MSMMSAYSGIARRILGLLNRDVVPEVKENGQRVEEFQNKVRAAMSTPREATYHISFLHCGSAYEGLAVDVNTDFDISVLLEKPFESDNFMVSRDPSGFFTLEWKSHIPNKIASDCDGYVDAAKIRRDLFDSLQRGIADAQIPDAEVKCSEGLAALTVLIEYKTGRKVSIDLVPQIVFRTWGQCPDLKPLEEMPKSLRRYIDTLNKNKSPIMCFSLAVPNARIYPNIDQLFNISFSLLEKKFVTSNVKLRDMVRLVKLIAKQRDWKRRYGFQSYFAKRVAVKYCDELEGKDEWEGYKALLVYLSQEVGKGSIDGYFISNQVTYTWTPEKGLEFQEEIAQAMSLDPREIERSM